MRGESNFTFTPASAEHVDPALVSEYQARLAKLKPACVRCGRVLTKKELATRKCAARDDCLLRQIFKQLPASAWGMSTAKPTWPKAGKPLALAEIKSRREFLARKAVPSAEGLPVLPPACLRCGKKLSARELAAGRDCSGRAACTKRMILNFRAPNFLAERYAEAWALAQKTPEIEEAIAA